MWVSALADVDVDVDVDVDLKDASGVAVVWALKRARTMSGWLPTWLFLFLLLSLSLSLFLLEESNSAEVWGA